MELAARLLVGTVMVVEQPQCEITRKLCSAFYFLKKAETCQVY